MSRTKNKARRDGLPKGKGKRIRDETDETTDSPVAKKQQTQRPEQTEYDEALAMMDPTILSDHVAKAVKRHLSDSTTIELEDKFVSSKAFRDTTSFTEPRVAKHLPAFLERFTTGGKDALSTSDTVASPHTIIVTASGIRAADIHREVRCFGSKDSKITKLFAKHMKLKESVEFVTKNQIGVAVGTPSRLNELVVQDALKTGSLRRIVVDGSYTDEKKRTIFDIKEVFLPMVDFLNNEKIKSKLDTQGAAMEILVF